MAISMTITGEDEIDFRRQFLRIAVPMLENFAETGGFNDPEPAEAEPEQTAATTVTPEPTPETPRKQGRPKGSTNKPKSNGAEPQPETQTAPPPNGAGEPLSLAEQIQIITDAAHDQPDKFKPLLVPLRDKLGVQYVSKAAEKDRPVLQEFINEHGLAV